MRSKLISAPCESVRRAGFDIAVFLTQLGAQMLQRGDVQIDGPCADGATAGQGNAGDAAAGQQGAQHEAGSAHGLDQIVGGFRPEDLAGLNGDAADVLAFTDMDFRPGMADEIEHGADVANLRDSVENDGVGGEQAGRDRGQSRVLGAADRDGSFKRRAAVNEESVQELFSQRSFPRGSLP